MTSFYTRLKPLNLGWLFIWWFFLSKKWFSSSNFVSTQPCPQGFFNLFWHEKEKKSSDDVDSVDSRILCDTFDILLLIRSKFFSIFFNRKTPSYWQNLITLIICVTTIISYYHLASLHEKNQDHHLLAASQW